MSCLNTPLWRYKDIVVTVPLFYAQFEHNAIVEAVNFTGLCLLVLVNDGVAVVVNYAMTRQFAADTPEHHIVYDAGAASTCTSRSSTTVATFLEQSQGKGKKDTGTLITVNGVGYNRLMGSVELDHWLHEILMEKFEHKHSAGSHEDALGTFGVTAAAGI